MTTGWLINDSLTRIPGTRTLWHDLLDAIPGLLDMTGGWTDFSVLAAQTVARARHEGAPNYIIRNASYFGPLDMRCPQICLLQDILADSAWDLQVEVCNRATVVVYNSPYTAARYRDHITTPSIVIPVGTNFDLFCPALDRPALKAKWGIPERCVVYVGSSAVYPKGFDRVLECIEKSNLEFCLVMKDDFTLSHPRVRIFRRVSQLDLREILSACEVLLCTSREETLHLAGVEAAACNVPLVVPRVGIYYDMEENGWGRVVRNDDFLGALYDVLRDTTRFNPRRVFQDKNLDLISSLERWRRLVEWATHLPGDRAPAQP
jgi:glycosyltransferase involved in cell wall biosynthesis